MSNILVELGWNTLMAVIIFFCSYYAIDFVRNTNSGDQTERGGLFFLLLWQYMLFVSTFAHSAIVWIDLPEMASTLTLFLWMLCILFCGYVHLSSMPFSSISTKTNFYTGFLLLAMIYPVSGLS